MAKISENDDDDNTTNRKTAQLVSIAVIVNKRITTPVDVEFRPKQGSSKLNVSKSYRNIFLALKLNDPMFKIITS